MKNFLYVLDKGKFLGSKSSNLLGYLKYETIVIYETI